MDSFLIEGPTNLSGRIRVHGSKNAALPLLFSSILFDGEIDFEQVPRLWDIQTTLALLQTMGMECHWDKESSKVKVLPSVKSKVASYDLVKKMRAGILALGPLIAKYGEAKVSLPGGCAIGARPVNFHLKALERMGVEVSVEGGYIHAKVRGKLKGAEILFPQVTVTGTENILYAAVLAEGKTIIKNAAKEPEVVCLGEFLNSCGAEISGLGTDTIEIVGGQLTAPANPVSIPPDRIETGTWIAISAATKSDLTIENCVTEDQTAVIEAFSKMGVRFELPPTGTEIQVYPPEKLNPIEIETQPYPAFATDMQAQLMVSMCLAEGKSRISESIFENRYMHVAELRRLGAKIDISGSEAVVHGPTQFIGAPMMATDLRASASLVIAALCAKGKTRLSRIYHLDRGYERLDERLSSLGAKIERIQE